MSIHRLSNKNTLITIGNTHTFADAPCIDEQNEVFVSLLLVVISNDLVDIVNSIFI